MAALTTARWTIDALAHQTSINDLKARDKLASRMTVAEYDTVLRGESDSYIDSAYRSRVRRDMLILFLFSIVFLALTIGALKRKDSL